MTNASYSRAILPSASVSSPGMSIAHSRANLTWSASKTSSLNPCRAPSGNAMRRTGRSREESQLAAFTRCLRCSRLVWMSLRLRMPRTVGISPTAVYGLIIVLPQCQRDAAGCGRGRHPAARVFRLRATKSPAPGLSRSLERDPKRQLNLPRRPHELRRAEAGISRRRDPVTDVLGHRPGKLGQPVDVVHVFHVHLVQEVEEFDAALALDFLIEVEAALNAQRHVGEIVADVGIASDEPHTVREREVVAVGVKPGVDRRTARALHGGDDRGIEMPQYGIHIVGHFSEEGYRKPVGDMVVAHGAVPIDMRKIFRGVRQIDGRLNVHRL